MRRTTTPYASAGASGIVLDSHKTVDASDTIEKLSYGLARSHAKRTERNLLGAWQAGYGALVVVHEPPKPTQYGETSGFGLGSYRYIPTNAPEAIARATSRGTKTVYDLADVDVETIEQARGAEP